MESSKQFSRKLAFYTVDDWNYGYIDKQNLKLFLKKHGYHASDNEALTIIRRIDLDGDARLTREEFFNALSPNEPYSKLLKRNSLKQSQTRKAVLDSLMRKSSHSKSQLLLTPN